MFFLQARVGSWVPAEAPSTRHFSPAATSTAGPGWLTMVISDDLDYGRTLTGLIAQPGRGPPVAGAPVTPLLYGRLPIEDATEGHRGMLQLHRAERADRLVEALAEILAVPPDDPMTSEVIAVPARGIERWLTQELSGRLGATPGKADGVAANIDFPFPATLVGHAIEAAAGLEQDTDPWAPQRLVWPVLDVLEDRSVEGAWIDTLRRNVGADGDEARAGRRFSAARHIADLFDRYGVHRPSMLIAWERGKEVDGHDNPLSTTDVWQARLWREVRNRLPVPSPAERLVGTVTALRGGFVVPDVPGRVGIFGLTALPHSYIDVIGAMAEHTDVHMFLLHPSRALWESAATMLRRQPKSRRRDDDPTRPAAVNPLLGSWGRDSREMQVVLSIAGAGDGEHRPLEEPAEPTLLQRVQADVRANRAPAPPRVDQLDVRETLQPEDRSLQVHACHGRTRQVEVLRDAILHLLADDPSLEPRDILVMCPDIETYAPLISAVFGAAAVTQDGAPVDGALPDLRVRLADRAIRQTNPVLRAMAELLALADSRLTASEVLDFAGREPVRRRFRFDDDDLGRLESWVAAAGIRWGMDADHRAAFGLGGVSENTWRAGLDRILLGVTMADEEDRLVGGVCPLDDVPEQEVAVAGRLAELVERLDTHLIQLRKPQTVEEWATALVAAADGLMKVGERDDWQRLQLLRMVGGVVEESTVDGQPSNLPLALAEVRTLLDDRLRGRPTRANHRTGDLTICTLVPMRSVPHRVICLLGLDEGAFPRRTTGDGDDLLDREPYVGDRDPRTEDRQLLLDALMAATDTLVVTYTGRNVRTNETQPPAVPIGELLDVVDRTVRLPDERIAARTQIVVEHPLQPYDARNFTPDALGRKEPWGFDRTRLEGALAIERDAEVVRTFLNKPLEPVAEAEIQLDELIRFVEHPVKTFLRRRLDVYLPENRDETSVAIPVELDPLEQWSLGDKLLAARLDGSDAEAWTLAERARGTLPPGALAEKAIETVTENVDAVLAAASKHVSLEAERVPLTVRVTLPGDRVVLGTVPDLVDDTLVSLKYSKLGTKHRLAAWVRLLAATAHDPPRELTAVTVGRCRKNKDVSISTMGPLGETQQERGAEALRLLGELVDLYDRGLREPLPLYCKTSGVWAEAVRDGRDPNADALKAWQSGFFPNEDRDAYHQLVLGTIAPYDDIGEDERFCSLAHELWDPLLANEDIEDC